MKLLIFQAAQSLPGRAAAACSARVEAGAKRPFPPAASAFSPVALCETTIGTVRFVFRPFELPFREGGMSMTFSQVVKLVDPLDLTVHAIADGNAEFFEIRQTDGGAEDYREDTLYLCRETDLPTSLPATKLYSFFVFGELGSLPPQLHNVRVNLVSIASGVDAAEVLKLVQAKLREERHMRSTLQRLTAALLSNKGLSHLIRTAYDILGNPLFVMDASENCIAKELGETVINPESVFATFVERTTPHPEQDANAAAYLKQIRKAGVLSSERAVNRFTNELFGFEQMQSSIRVNGIVVASFSVFAYNHPFSDFDEAIFTQLGPYLSQELQKQSVFRTNRNENKAYFLNALLTWNSVTEANIERMLLVRNIATIRDKFYVAVIEMSPLAEKVDHMMFQTVAQQLKPILSGSFYLIRETELVILFNLPNAKSFNGFIDEMLTQQAVTNRLLIGVSNMFRDLTQTKKHYLQAKEALTLNRDFNKWKVAYYSLIAPVRALHIVRDHDDLLSFCMPELLDLLHIDRENNAEYMLTLYYYLEAFGSTSAAAAKLHIHKNTLLYRLTKIKEILGCDLSDGEDIYRLMMSFRILRMLSLFSLPDSETIRSAYYRPE